MFKVTECLNMKKGFRRKIGLGMQKLRVFALKCMRLEKMMHWLEAEMNISDLFLIF